MCESYHEPSQRENQNKEENKNVKEDLRENNNSWKCSNKQNLKNENVDIKTKDKRKSRK